MAPQNIVSGFKVSGIYPFNSEIFNEDEFLPSAVTDRPLVEIDDPQVEPSTNEEPQPTPSTSQIPNLDVDPLLTPSTKPQPTPSTSYEAVPKVITPEELHPYPETGARKVTKKGRKRMKSEILTDSLGKD